jgi:formylglycine-generating enzyme required for sulfatase activity
VPLLADGKPRGGASGLWGWDDHPVITSWDEAQAFCAWLSQKEGKKYRLPADEEWSRAVGIGASEKRGPGTTPEDLSKTEVGTFPWGTDWPPPPGSGNFGDASFHAMTAATHPDKDLALYDDGFAETAPVMSFKPNKLGLYDLAGNVAEWCEDWYNGARSGRLIRGCGYKEITRSRAHPSYRTTSVSNDAFVAGFRLVLEQP